MKKKGIYNNEKIISEDIKNRISLHYVNRRNEYVDTIRYYIEYMNYLETLTQKRIGFILFLFLVYITYILGTNLF